jgi:hypothetical protein
MVSRVTSAKNAGKLVHDHVARHEEMAIHEAIGFRTGITCHGT